MRENNKKLSTPSKEIKDAFKTKGKLQGMNDLDKKKILKILKKRKRSTTALRSQETVNINISKHYYLLLGGFPNN